MTQPSHRTFVSTARCRITSAATVLQFLQHQGIPVSSKSELFELALEACAKAAIDLGYTPCESPSEALKILTLANLTPGTKNRMSLINELQSFEVSQNLANQFQSDIQDIEVSRESLMPSPEQLKTIIVED